MIPLAGMKHVMAAIVVRRIKTELTNKSSKKDDLNRNRPITLLNSFYLFHRLKA